MVAFPASTSRILFLSILRQDLNCNLLAYHTASPMVLVVQATESSSYFNPLSHLVYYSVVVFILPQASRSPSASGQVPAVASIPIIGQDGRVAHREFRGTEIAHSFSVSFVPCSDATFFPRFPIPDSTFVYLVSVELLMSTINTNYLVG